MARKLIVTTALLALGVAAAVAVPMSRSMHASKTENGTLKAEHSVRLSSAPVAPVSRFDQVVETHGGGARETHPRSAGMAEVKREWAGVQAKVRQLDSTDQAGLAELYAQARTVIRANENALSKVLTNSIPELVNASLEESFFTISAWIRASEHPADIVQALLSYEPPIDPPSTDMHHVEQTPAVRYERMESYAFKELRTQLVLGNIKLEPSAQKSLVETLVPRATREQSLNLALEQFQLLAALEEQAAIQTALAGHSPRDQQIIQAVLSAR